MLGEIHHKWKLFGVQLGLLPDAIHDIEAQGPDRDLNLCLQKALEKWMMMDGENRTWLRVCEAVKKCDNNRLAGQLRTAHKHELESETLHTIMCMQVYMKINYKHNICV